jgi:hypothetical protein
MMQGRRPVVANRLYLLITTLGDRNEEECKKRTLSSTPMKSDVNDLKHCRARLYRPDFLFVDFFLALLLSFSDRDKKNSKEQSSLPRS